MIVSSRQVLYRFAVVVFLSMATHSIAREMLMDSSLGRVSQALSIDDECQGQIAVTIDGPRRYEGDHLCETRDDITTRYEVVVGRQANVIFRSASINIGRLFQVEKEAVFSAQTGGGVNRGLTGRLFMGHDSDGWILDLYTGKYSRIPGVDWEGTDPDYGGFMSGVEYYACPVAYDGAEFVVTVDRCDPDSGDPNYTLLFSDCMMVLKRDGSRASDVPLLKLIDSIRPYAKLSRDRQYLAFVHDDRRYSNKQTLFITNRTGSQLISGVEYNGVSYIGHLDWLPDGHLVFAHDNAIYISDSPYSANGVPLAVFTEEQGLPRQLAVSPDGKQLAFTLVTNTSFTHTRGTTWVMDVDGENLRQLTDFPIDNDPATTADDPVINWPTWSPDGKWILVVVGYTHQADIWSTLGISAGAYVVPADGERVMLTTKGQTHARQLQSYFNMTLHDDPEMVLKTDFSDNGGLSWLP